MDGLVRRYRGIWSEIVVCVEGLLQGNVYDMAV